MKLGVSTYSLSRAILAGELSPLETIDWISAHGGEHVEVVPKGFDLIEDRTLAGKMRERASERGLEISNYCIAADFLKGGVREYEAEIERVKQHVHAAAELGVRFMRHDAARKRPPDDISLSAFEADLPRLIEAYQRIAEHAEQYEITTSVENHGFYIQNSERVYRLVEQVNRPNFKTTLDIGNFLCADEDLVLAVRRNIGIASMVHLKDFYRRSPSSRLGEGWFRSAGGYYLRGAILGHGDVDVPEIMKTIRDSGYAGYITLEFEGMEECRLGSRLCLEQARLLLSDSG